MHIYTCTWCILCRLLCIIIFPVSELEADDDVVSVDVTSSCYSSVLCSPMEPIDECTAYCGVSGNIEDLIMTDSGSSSELVNGVITIRLPPATGTSYHCVVTGSRDDGSIVFRGRQQQTLSGRQLAVSHVHNNIIIHTFILCKLSLYAFAVSYSRMSSS